MHRSSYIYIEDNQWVCVILISNMNKTNSNKIMLYEKLSYAIPNFWLIFTLQ